MPKTLKRVVTLDFLKQMKKKTINFFLCSAVMIAVGFGLQKSYNNSMVSTTGSDLVTENVEALRNADVGVQYSCRKNYIAGKWPCVWYLSGASCTGCKKP
mgnify:CR=1 FL=1